MKSSYVITPIDHYSRFVLARPILFPATGHDVSKTLRMMVEFFHISPDIVQTDNGTEFASRDFCHVASQLNCQRTITPVGC